MCRFQKHLKYRSSRLTELALPVIVIDCLAFVYI